MDNDWLQNVKVGDEVASSGNFGTPSILKVTRITKTQIVTDRQRWRKSDGKPLGRGYTLAGLCKLSPIILREIESQKLLGWLAHFEESQRNGPIDEKQIEILRAVKSTVERLTDSDK